MRKRIITCALTLAMIFSVLSNPALGYATTEADAFAVTNETANTEVTFDVTNTTNNNAADDEANKTAEPELEDDSSGVQSDELEAVQDLKATAVSYKTIKLSWSPVANATEYHIYRYNKTQDEYLYLKKTTDVTAKDYNLTKSTTYYYKVKAVMVQDDESYEGELSNYVKCKTNPYLVKPAGVKAKGSSCSTIKITWKKVSGAKGYEVYRYSKAKKKYLLIKTTSNLYFNNSKLKADTSYSYKVRAYTVQDGKKFYSSFSSAVKGKTEKTDPEKIKALAYSKIDCQYRWGAKGPKKFDCSGFVYWVYNNADVTVKKKVPKTSSAGMYSALDKYMIGRSVKSLNKAKVGDIIFFKRGGRVSHVGIYYGNGKMIHAANARKDICIESVKDYNKWGYKVVGIARVLK